MRLGASSTEARVELIDKRWAPPCRSRRRDVLCTNSVTERAAVRSEIRRKAVRGCKSEDEMPNGFGLTQWAWSGRSWQRRHLPAVRWGSRALQNPTPKCPTVSGTLATGLGTWNQTARSGCGNAVIAAPTFTGGFSAVRQRLREWLCDGSARSTPSPNRDRRPRPLRPADATGSVAVEIRRPRARHRPDDALRQAARHRRERGLSGMRHPCRLGCHARQQAGQADRLASEPLTACRSPFPQI